MAHLNEKTNQIIFNQTDRTSAWQNAPQITDADPKLYRVCLNCQFPMKNDQYVTNYRLKHQQGAWTIDLINLKKPKLVGKNFLAIHADCFGLRQKPNENRRLKKYQHTKWLMPRDN